MKDTKDGRMSFDDQLSALEAYEQGMALAKKLNAQLDQAEKRILEIAGDTLRPMEADGDE